MPAETTVRLLRKAMETSGKSRFLIDGFPRNPDNLAAWEASTADGAVVVDFAMFLDCSEEVRCQREVRYYGMLYDGWVDAGSYKEGNIEGNWGDRE